MKKRILAIALALGLLTVTVPAGMAAHLSVGFTDTAGTEAREASDNPSVEGNTTDNTSTPYGVGTSTDCYEPEGNADPGEVTEAATSNAFCGRLVYNQDAGGGFVRDSPPDQQYNGNDLVERFDVQRTYYTGNFLTSTCFPMCDDGEDRVPVQNTTWNATHEAGSTVGITEKPQDAHEKRDGEREQWLTMRMDIRHAPGIIQDSPLGPWEMNGWTAAFATEHWVGWLYDDQTNPISDDRLQRHVQQNITGPETTAKVCGYTPDITFSSTGQQSFCDTPLLYAGGNDSAENHADGPGPASGFGSYNDRCKTPTYFCGAVAGDGYWVGEAIGLAAYGGDVDDYTTWHWTVAPNQPDCGLTQPGFDLDVSGEAADHPFLAHDLDVYTPPTALTNEPTTVSEANVGNYLDAANPLPDVDGLTEVGPIDDARAAVEDETAQIKEDIVEPNHVSSDTGEPINTSYASVDIREDSRNIIEESTSDPCELLASDETNDTRDPWVNIVDNGVVNNREAGVYLGVADTDESLGPVGLYGNDDATQDKDNDPTTDSYTTSGKVGVFADRDDDGEYDQITGSADSTDGFSPAVYQPTTIQENGAYPMFWDMIVNETAPDEAEPMTDEGCEFGADSTLTETMANAGYGVNTGLAQAIYLAEPAAFYDLDATDPQIVESTGDSIFLLGSQAVHELWDGELDDGVDGHQLSEDVDTLLESVRAYTNTEHDAGISDEGDVSVNPDVRYVADEMNRLGDDTYSDYFSQCSESTGGYQSGISFTHNCEQTGCEGDTIATMYSYEADDPELGGSLIPSLQIDGDNYQFPTAEEDSRWVDIDAFDGNADRNEQRQDPPPTGSE